MERIYDRDVVTDFERAERLEWLEPNGLGGWAASTVSGAHSRRYHGLLVAATTPPTGRLVLLSRLDETVLAPDGRFELAANRFPGAVHPTGHRHLERFARDVMPVWEYAAGRTRLRKTIVALHGVNATVVVWERLGGTDPVTLELRPFFAGRDYHSLTRANDAIAREATVDGDRLEFRAYADQPTVFLSAPGAKWEAAPDWWRDFEYLRERERGLDFREDLFTPGLFRVVLEPGARFAVLAATDPAHGSDPLAAFERERQRRLDASRPWQASDPLCDELARAAADFVVRRGEDLHTVIAGYPWFTDWGRDTMIALPGLCLVTGEFERARQILRAFARACDQGMLPNRFPDRGEAPEYNTVDASLWFFVACRAFRRAGGDERFVRDELLPVLREIVDWHRRGTRYGIREDRDGLLAAGEPGVQLTWMDAKVGERVITPRSGKPVEINALWYNALRILAELETALGDPERARDLASAAERVRARFVERFWNPDSNCLYDVVDGTGDAPDASLRPNQVFALSLPYPLLTGHRARAVLDAVERHLVTPFGLRSLAPGDPSYVGRYEGGVPERDGAYHQGTAWAWLLGPYATALVRVRGEAGRRAARELLRGIDGHLGDACIGHVSEIFDGDPPHAPRGCPAQAWSIAEILRAAVEDVGLPLAADPAQDAGVAARPPASSPLRGKRPSRPRTAAKTRSREVRP